MRNLFGFLLGIIIGVVGALLFVPLVGKEFVIEVQTRLQALYRQFEINLWGIAYDVKDHVSDVLQGHQPSVDTSGDLQDNDSQDKNSREDDDMTGGKDA